MTSADLISRVHAALDEYYSGGDAEALRQLVTTDVRCPFDAHPFDEIWS